MLYNGWRSPLRNKCALTHPPFAPPPPSADSDNLQDLRELIQHVLDSNVLIIFQSKKVLERPWCLLELYAAATNGIPIVALSCAGKGYDFGAAADFLTHLDTALPKVNKTAVAVLEENGVSAQQVAHVLSSTIPNIISIHFNTSASLTAIKATMVDLANAMMAAKPRPVTTQLAEFLEQRSAKDAEAEAKSKRASLGIGTIRGTQKGVLLQKAGRAESLERDIAELKAAHKVAFAKLEAARNEEVAKLEARLEKSGARNEKLEAKIEKLEAKLGY